MMQMTGSPGGWEERRGEERREERGERRRDEGGRKGEGEEMNLTTRQYRLFREINK